MTEVGLGSEKEFEGYVCGFGRVVQEFLGVVERRKLGAEFAVFVHCTGVSIDRTLKARKQVLRTMAHPSPIHFLRGQSCYILLERIFGRVALVIDLGHWALEMSLKCTFNAVCLLQLILQGCVDCVGFAG